MQRLAVDYVRGQLLDELWGQHGEVMRIATALKVELSDLVKGV